MAAGISRLPHDLKAFHTKPAPRGGRDETCNCPSLQHHLQIISGFRLGTFAQEHPKRTEVVLNYLTDLPKHHSNLCQKKHTTN